MRQSIHLVPAVMESPPKSDSVILHSYSGCRPPETKRNVTAALLLCLAFLQPFLLEPLCISSLQPEGYCRWAHHFSVHQFSHSLALRKMGVTLQPSTSLDRQDVEERQFFQFLPSPLNATLPFHQYNQEGRWRRK